MKKEILVLVGSNSDIDKKGEPTPFAEDLDATVEALNSENHEKQIDYHLASCSADRTDQLLAEVINKKSFDGIVYHGGYSLVLGAAIQGTLNELRRHNKIQDWSTGTYNFFKRGETGKMAIPDITFADHAQTVIKKEKSNYCRIENYIPTIGVPGKDSVSLGVTALTSITENPSGCEPRPAVGLNRVDSAVECMYKMMYGMEKGFEGVSIVYEADGPAEEGAKKIFERLERFGVNLISSTPTKNIGEKRNTDLEDSVVLYVGNGYVPGQTEIARLDSKVNFMINCPVKQDMTTEGKWGPYLNVLTQLNNTVSVGVGNYDNAAILAAQLLKNPEVTKGIWEYRNGKTKTGVIDTPAWLKDGKVKYKGGK